MKLLILNLLSLALFIGCNQNNTTSNKQTSLTLNKDTIIQSPNNDSVEIIKLLREVYQWHDKNQNKLSDFDVIVKDSFQTSLNYESFNKTFEAIKRTNYFSSTFLNNYKKIADYINNKLTTANPKYQDKINFSCQEADPWTNFQDEAGNYWNNFKITDYKSSSDSASLQWQIKIDDWTSEKYPMKFVKENGKWKVSYLEGFDMGKYYK